MKRKLNMPRAAILGAILVHPVLFLAFILFGAAFGAVDVWNASRAPVFGWDGICMAAGNLFTIYFGTCGIVPLMISVVAAGFGVGVHLFRTSKTTFLKVIVWALSGAVIGAIGTVGVFLCMIMLHQQPANVPDMLVGAVVNGAVFGFLLGAICGIVRTRREARRAKR
jgi:hypothetical protein